ncbi:hypothetical protein GWK47_027184 [Chionoecetes opilio]|uniref:Uncharacterized protein n=1 Tax=Chionoecetes opilio TaxID=41210 RepID=A0A8J8WKX3_CHIOP|nr:hypothetical protein GWK47_027184 [Chionoecetes opilio]
MRLFDGLFKSFKSVRPSRDYREFGLNLSSFSGGCPSRWNSIPCSWKQCTQGPMDVKSPLLLQDLDVRGQFRLTKKRRSVDSKRLCLFVVRVYAKARMRLLSRFKPSTRPPNHLRPSAPTTRSTLRGGDVALSKLFKPSVVSVRRNWLGCPSSTPKVSCETKNAMVTALRREEFDGEGHGSEKSSRFQRSGPRSPPGRLRQWTPTSHFFRKLHLDEAFLDLPNRTLWQMDEGFQRSSQIVRNLAVVNDHGKEGVALIPKVQRILTRMRSSSVLLQVVGGPPEGLPDPREKRTLAHTRPQ